MPSDLDALICDLLEWIEMEPRRYADVMDAWRTSCPKLPVWEDSVDRGFVVREHAEGLGAMIRLTPLGRSFLCDNGRMGGQSHKQSGTS